MTTAPTLTPVPTRDRYTLLLCSLLTLATVITTVIGAVLWYNPIPHLDSWDIIINFIIQMQEGHYDHWWKLHYEHRYILPHAVFWIDHLLFNSNNVFLMVITFLLIIFDTWFFRKILCELLPERKNTAQVWLVTLVMIALMFSWDLKVDLTWGLHFQYYLAQGMILGAFYYLHRQIQTQSKHNRQFILAILLGLCSMGTMANGILTLPLMCVFAAVTKMGWRRTVSLIVISVISLTWYFHDYVTPEHHGNSMGYFFSHPLEAYHFVMLFLGHPFFFIAGKSTYGALLAFLMGQVLVYVTLYKGYRLWSEKDRNTLQMVLVFFILAVIASAGMSAGGRLFKGVMYALSPRYAAPAILGWTGFIVLCAPAILRLFENQQRKFNLLCTALLLAPLPMQMTAFEVNHKARFFQEAAALALSLQVADKEMLSHIYPNFDEHINYKTVLNIADQAMKHDLSIFNRDPYSDIRSQWGRPVSVIVGKSASTCDGQLNRIQVIPEDDRYLRISGWIADTTNQKVPGIVWLLNDKSRVVGVAITGMPHEQLTDKIGRLAETAGYVGYLRADQQGQLLTIQTENPDFTTSIRIPQIRPASTP